MIKSDSKNIDFDFSGFSCADRVKILTKAIKEKAKKKSDFYIMEVCGTHTMSIARFALRDLLPDNVKLLSGPGCPVCVTSNKDIDYMISLSDLPNVIITTFGDMMRVPGSTTSLLEKKSSGKDIRVVYSPLDAIKIAMDNPNKEVIFLAVGFETTTPTTAAVIRRAALIINDRSLGNNSINVKYDKNKKNYTIKNFSVFCAHKNMPNALEQIASDPDIKLDGLILPGHVSTIIGTKPYLFLAKEFGISGVVAGFDPVDILQAIYMLLSQDKPDIEIAYSRGVKKDGNKTAQNLIRDVFDIRDSDWRGLGTIKDSGYSIKNCFSYFDASKKFNVKLNQSKEHSGCKCGEVLRGKIKPNECGLYKRVCSPQSPVGPCMVSTEGTCAAYFKYHV